MTMLLAFHTRVLVFSCLLSTAGVAAMQAQEIPAAPSTPADAAERRKIEALLQSQADAWNHGDIDAFMEGYAKTADLRFASGGTVTRGWQQTLERYRQRYPDRAAMGTLAFSGLETTVLSPDAAVVFGHWKLQTARGLFTLLLRRTEAAGWRIVADHTSAASTP